MWPNMNTTLSGRACCTVILHAKKNMLPWKQIHMEAVLAVLRCCSEAYPTVRGSHLCGVSLSTFLVARWCHSPSLLVVEALGIYIHSECKPSWLWQCAFFFSAAAAESVTPPSALQRRAGLRVVLRLGSGLHLKLSFPDCFSCYEHLPCQSHLRWLTGSLLLRENLSRFISP